MPTDAYYRDLCAVILAGGQSRRMGSDKAMLIVRGRPLIDLVVDKVRSLTDSILISCNETTPYAFMGLPAVQDVYRGQGPLAGLHAAMKACSRPLYLLLACDLPEIQAALLHTLIRNIGDCDAVIPRTSDGRVHPLAAVYRRSCLPRLEHNLERGVNRVTDLFLDSALRVRWLGPTEGGFEDSDLHNLNTPEDLAAYRVEDVR